MPSPLGANLVTRFLPGEDMRTQVAIVGGGPSGLLLSLLLHRDGIDNIVLERHTREHVLGRIRAGVLEPGTVDLLRRAGAADRLERDCLHHRGALIAFDQEHVRIDLVDRTGQGVVVYGQTEVTRDLYEARDAQGAVTIFEACDLSLHALDGSRPRLAWTGPDGARELSCDYVVGCDGFHGVSRRSIPAARRREHERAYPFAWLGVLSRTPPVHDELVYAASAQGFALCSMRHANLSRYYVQCPVDDRLEDWSDERFWSVLKSRMPSEFSDTLITGESIEKSISPLRSFVSEPMRWGRLFLCGDAAHIVPPTGAKGLNLACGDVHYLSRAFERSYRHADDTGLDTYSANALDRVWKCQRFAVWMTSLLHRFPGQSGFERRLQAAEFAHLREQGAAQDVFARNYVGLPL